jgi:hypothetical protein
VGTLDSTHVLPIIAAEPAQTKARKRHTNSGPPPYSTTKGVKRKIGGEIPLYPKVYTRSLVSARYPPSTIPLPAAATPACIPTYTTQHDYGAAVMKSYYTHISDMTYAPFRRNTLPLRGCWQALGVITPSTSLALSNRGHRGGNASRRPEPPQQAQTIGKASESLHHDNVLPPQQLAATTCSLASARVPVYYNIRETHKANSYVPSYYKLYHRSRPQLETDRLSPYSL